MDSLKNYIWAEMFNVSEKDFNHWQSKPAEQSFLSWSLKKKIIDRDEYFNWAKNFYELPIIENIFFEQNLIKHNQWDQIKNLMKWNEEISPIFLWENVSFVGCLERPKDHESWKFQNRLVLVTDLALNIHYKSLKSLENQINNKKEMQKEISTQKIILTNKKESKHSTVSLHSEEEQDLKILSLDEKNDSKEDLVISSGMNDSKPQATSSKIENVIVLDDGQDKLILDEDENLKEDLVISSGMNDSKPQATSSKIENVIVLDDGQDDKITKKIGILLENNLPDKHQDERQKDSANDDFPERESQPEENQTLVFQKSSTDTVTSIAYKVTSNTNYNELYSQLKTDFPSALILENKQGTLSILDSSGCNIQDNQTKEVSSFNENSIFKIVGRGHSYNGFVVDNEHNKKFFKNIGREEYPKHVTAIPIKNSKNQIYFIFVGLANHSLTRQAVEEITQNVLNFFNQLKTKKTHKQAA